MDDFYQFMSPLEGATPPTFGAGTTQGTSTSSATSSTEPTSSASSSDSTTTTAATEAAAAATSSRSSWSSWGASFNKLIERGKKDMNEFVEVTRKDLNELAQTVQQERSTAMESLTKRVEGIKTTLPPIPASVNTASADILGRMSHVVEGIKQEITEAATGLSSQPTSEDSESERASEEKELVADEGSSSKDTTDGEQTTPIEKESTSTSTPTLSTSSRAEKSAAALTFASTASLLSAGASSLSQTLTSSTKDISTTANQLLKKMPAVAEKHLGEADHFLKSTTESLKTNGLLAEQYVNKFGAGMANFLNNAVVISAPEEKEVSSKSKKMFFDRKAAILEKLRMDPDTYIVDPLTTIADNDVKGLERYKYFLQTFNMAEYQQRIARLLNEYPEMKALMNKLVPVDVADEELFWQRYYFRFFEIEEEEKRRQKLVQEVGADLAEEEFTWDDNDDEDEDETSGGQGSVTPKAERKASDTQTPKSGNELSTVDNETGEEKEDEISASTLTLKESGIKREPLVAEALASSLAALPIPEDGGVESSDAVITSSLAPATTTESEDEWGSESVRSTASPSAQSFSIKSSTASSPQLEQSVRHQSNTGGKQKSNESKDEDDWSDWE
ncbi:hypothetical protein BGZ83_001559 [Gryganskiella cystojenkinii]|nr:hypothetical protein BGZ83_001559 [Gryganskiella cystojenkinii]